MKGWGLVTLRIQPHTMTQTPTSSDIYLDPTLHPLPMACCPPECCATILTSVSLNFKSFRDNICERTSAAALRTSRSSSSRDFKSGWLAVGVPSGACESTAMAANRTLHEMVLACADVKRCQKMSTDVKRCQQAEYTCPWAGGGAKISENLQQHRLWLYCQKHQLSLTKSFYATNRPAKTLTEFVFPRP